MRERSRFVKSEVSNLKHHSTGSLVESECIYCLKLNYESFIVFVVGGGGGCTFIQDLHIFYDLVDDYNIDFIILSLQHANKL